jgi:hypothetical protein
LQTPPLHDALTWLLEQTMPHPPQLFTSLLVSTQAPAAAQ